MLRLEIGNRSLRFFAVGRLFRTKALPRTNHGLCQDPGKDSASVCHVSVLFYMDRFSWFVRSDRPVLVYIHVCSNHATEVWHTLWVTMVAMLLLHREYELVFETSEVDPLPLTTSTLDSSVTHTTLNGTGTLEHTYFGETLNVVATGPSKLYASDEAWWEMQILNDYVAALAARLLLP